VYEITQKKGLRAGMEALRFRIHNCNSEYSLIDVGKEKILITKTHHVLRENDVASFLL
jgi:hypothetical protein